MRGKHSGQGETATGKSRFRGLRKRFSASLSLKLIGIFVSGSIALAVVMGSLSQIGLERQFLSTARPLFDHYVDYLAREVGSPPSVRRARVLTDKWPVTIRIFDSQRDIHWASDGRMRPPRMRHSGEIADRPVAGSKSAQSIRPGPVFWDHGTVLLQRRVGTSIVYYGLRLRPAGPPWFPIIFIGLVLLGLYGFYLLTRRLFAPIDVIQEGLTKIGNGQLDFRIQMNRSDELGSLASHVNDMAEQLESMLQARRDLLLAISHELKSPLARSRVTLALLDDSSYQQALLRDQLEMQNLIDGIIAAERNQSDFAVLHRQQTDIKALLESLVSTFEADGKTGLELRAEAVYVNIDRSQIERLVRNLLENALRYNRPEQGLVTLEAFAEEAELVLIVSDFGPGVEAAHINRLTEAFYRVDPSRERNSGGLGLGLYLCQAVVDAHGGSLEISSVPGKGTKVLCRIPEGDV